MNIARIKLLLWAVVLGLVAYLGWDVYQFLTVVKKEIATRLPEEVQKEALLVEEPDEEQRAIVPYQRVETAFWMKWDGRPEPKEPVKTGTENTPVATPRKPVSELLTILLIQYHTGKPEESIATVVYSYGPKEKAVLKKGDHLRGKHDYAYVTEITADYVEVAFDVQEGEEEREPERVSPPEYTKSGKSVLIVDVGEDGSIQAPAPETFIDVAANVPRWNPTRTTEVRKNQFIIGTEDATNVAENWSGILSREVRTRRYRDPQTGRYAGIQVSSISPGSIVEAHGLQAGDVIKSINGEPVTSTQEAISYVKTNAETTNHWEAIIERQGREMTVTYDYQPQN